MIKTIFTVVALVFSMNVNAQLLNNWEVISFKEFEEISKMTTRFYLNEESYYFTINHASYSDYISLKSRHKSEGYYYKIGKNFCLESMGSKLVKIEKIQLTIIEDLKEILVNDAIQTTGIEVLDSNNQLYRTVEGVSKRTHGDVMEIQLYYKIGMPYTSLLLKINSEGFIEKIVFFFSKKIEWVDENGNTKITSPRVEVRYKLIAPPQNFDNFKFKLSNYLVTNSKGNLSASKKYNNFSIKDLRINKK